MAALKRIVCKWMVCLCVYKLGEPPVSRRKWEWRRERKRNNTQQNKTTRNRNNNLHKAATNSCRGHNRTKMATNGNDSDCEKSTREGEKYIY